MWCSVRARIPGLKRSRPHSRTCSTMKAPWIVADMDNTLIDKGPGAYPTLKEGPCYGPLMRWLRLGGNLLCVTSDDGYRPFTHFWDEIDVEYRTNGQVLLSTAGGATLFRGNENGGVDELVEYWKEVKGGLPNPDQATALGCSMLRDFFLDAQKNPSLLSSLDGRRREEYQRILHENPTEEQLRAALTEGNMLSMSKLLKRGSLVWMNQAGPASQWVRKKDVGMHGKIPRYTNLFVLGFPKSVSGPYLSKYRETFESLGILASAAPNSVCLSNQAIDKGTAIRWLHENDSVDFSIEQALGVGDCPTGNDYPLTCFQKEGMPFVNCGATPSDHDSFFLGNFEHGTARLITGLNDSFEEHVRAENSKKGLHRTPFSYKTKFDVIARAIEASNNESKKQEPRHHHGSKCNL